MKHRQVKWKWLRDTELGKWIRNHSRVKSCWFLRCWKLQKIKEKRDSCFIVWLTLCREKFSVTDLWTEQSYVPLDQRKLTNASSSSSEYLSLAVCSILMKIVPFDRLHDRNLFVFILIFFSIRGIYAGHFYWSADSQLKRGINGAIEWRIKRRIERRIEWRIEWRIERRNETILTPTTRKWYIEPFHMMSRRPCWCTKTKERRPYWCTRLTLRVLNSFLMQILSFFFIKPIWPLVTWVKTLYSHFPS